MSALGRKLPLELAAGMGGKLTLASVENSPEWPAADRPLIAAFDPFLPLVARALTASGRKWPICLRAIGCASCKSVKEMQTAGSDPRAFDLVGRLYPSPPSSR